MNYGELSSSSLYRVYAASGTSGVDVSYGLRPVFTLKPGLKVTGGTGKPEDPYTLGV